MLMNYHIGRLVLSSLCVGAFGAAGFLWRSFCRLKQASACKTKHVEAYNILIIKQEFVY